jgi:hypothetical protein
MPSASIQYIHSDPEYSEKNEDTTVLVVNKYIKDKKKTKTSPSVSTIYRHNHPEYAQKEKEQTRARIMNKYNNDPEYRKLLKARVVIGCHGGPTPAG